MKQDIKLRFFDDSLNIYGKQVLNILLKDRTTGNNIIWATNDYVELGETYTAKNEISFNAIKSKNEKFIKPRRTKSYEKKNNRTKEKAEVFTPSWICNEQNNLVDEQWFGRKNVFNKSKGKKWVTSDAKIEFLDSENKNWKTYVDARRMEITCGEAPYIISRYDTVTGEKIPLKSRIGLLDRKMRIVNENTINEKEWFTWTERAFQSIYGFEFQGDSLILARENLLFTFIDNVQYKLERQPTLNELKKISTIISWNIWQMDGLTFTIPFSEERENYEQLSFFDSISNSNNRLELKYCKIKNWRSNVIFEYHSIIEGVKHG